MTSAPDAIERAVRTGAVQAIRRRAAERRRQAADGTLPAGDQFPGVMIRSRQAATAAALAVGLVAIADEIEAEARP